MSMQMTFGLHRATDPATSRMAAESVNALPLEDRVLAALRACPRGATTYALADGLELSLVTVSPRIKPLVRKGKVRDSGRKELGESGRAQTVWEAVPQ